MSLTSYRAAPPRAIVGRTAPQKAKRAAPEARRAFCVSDIVNGFFQFPRPPAAMPGDDLLFQCLSNSTIGAVRFHGRVRDGIGWVTDAMVTKQ